MSLAITGTSAGLLAKIFFASSEIAVREVPRAVDFGILAPGVF